VKCEGGEVVVQIAGFKKPKYMQCMWWCPLSSAKTSSNPSPHFVTVWMCIRNTFISFSFSKF